MSHECREIVFYSLLKNVHGSLSDGSALNQPRRYALFQVMAENDQVDRGQVMLT